MHKEFAIEPEVISSLDRLQFLLNCIGYDKGRLIIGCPDKTAWYRGVHSACKVDHDSTNKVTEKLARLMYDKKAVLNKKLNGWNENLQWIENAIKLDETNNGHLFDGIVAQTPDYKNNKVIGFESLDDENSIWRCTIGKAARNSESLVKAAGLLLKHSTEIAFVDRYINPNDHFCYEPLRLMLDVIFSSSKRLDKSKSFLKRLEVHTSFEVFSGNAEVVKESFSSKFSRHIPVGHSLVVKRWKWGVDKMHARYVLTDLGGISFDHGLSTGAGTTDIQLLTEDLRKERWKDYISYPKLVLHDEREIVINGQRRM